MGLKFYNPVTRVGLEASDVRTLQCWDPFVSWMMERGRGHPLLNGYLILSLVKQTGASGQVDSKTNSNVNSVLYSTFAAMGIFAR